MASREEIALVSHLMRRAGFGTTPDELEEYTAKGYDAVVDDMINPEQCPAIEEDIVTRYWGGESAGIWVGTWIYRMANSRRPLVEKMALFWHHVLATGISKTEHPVSAIAQVQMFRQNGMSDLKTVLLEVAKDPAMIYWLDNNENRNGEPNENFGRELLELFSMGVGNYTEDDIKSASRAFTGWTFTQPIPLYPQGHFMAGFDFREDQHDDGVKTFLGETGRFNGEDIIDIVVKQPATARFICRHLYNFFVADEPQVPAWPIEPPRDPAAIDTLTKAYFDSDGDIRSILRVMFNSDFFKEAAFKKVKSPTELVAGILKLVGTHTTPVPGITRFAGATSLMGQQLLNPPTVEGWHTGKEWIDGGTLGERINFAMDEVGDATKPGIQEFIETLSDESRPLSPANFTDRCLDLMGPLTVDEGTRDTLVEYAESGGTLDFGTDEQREASVPRVLHMLQMITATREFQFA